MSIVVFHSGSNITFIFLPVFCFVSSTPNIFLHRQGLCVTGSKTKKYPV